MYYLFMYKYITASNWSSERWGRKYKKIIQSINRNSVGTHEHAVCSIVTPSITFGTYKQKWLLCLFLKYSYITAGKNFATIIVLLLSSCCYCV